jgi:PTH1 family peptidyl-tRNA hydrolase
LIVGLGNPGREYAQTRHNMGFITLDHLAAQLGVDINRIKFKSLVGETRLSGQKVVLLKPQTYMNNSGEAVREAVSFYKIEPENLIVVYDDLDIELGTLRIRKKGSAGTHNGMRSVIRLLGFDNFPRVRVGIGSNGDTDIINYVIGGFRKEEVEPLERAVEQACRALKCYVEYGIEKAMQDYNGKC